MTEIVFYEKPGCTGNARQRALLEAAGHALQRRNLLTTAWTRAELRAFLDPLPVAGWFNRSAPRVKSGEVQPDALDAESALGLLLSDPLLIRRPLMQLGDGRRLVGFDIAQVEAFVGLGGFCAPADGPSQSLEACAAAIAPCASPAQPASRGGPAVRRPA